MRNYSIGEFANKAGVSIQTLRNWHKSGELIPSYITDGGSRYHSSEELDKLLGKTNMTRTRKVIGYCRVSSNKQKDDLTRQVENMRTYLLSRCSLQGKRAKKAKKMLKELLKNDDSI